MDLETVRQLTKNGESLTLEFKKTTGLIKQACETLCAFLNTHGGIVLIGVDDRGNLIGQDITDHTKQEIAKELKKIEPHVHINVSYIFLPNNQKTVLCLTVSEGAHKPYVYDGRAWKRIESITTQLSQEAYEQLLFERARFNHSWEAQPAINYSIKELDIEELNLTIAEGIQSGRLPLEAKNFSPEKILTEFELINNGQLTNAAVLLYGKEIKSNYPQCMLKMARFKGVNKTDNFIDNKQMYGNIFKLLSEAQLFIERHLPIAGLVGSNSFRRLDKPALPPLAVREAITNAVCHRDYSDPNTDIAIAIYDDRLEIWNNGNLLKPLTIADLKKDHISKRRNNRIAEVLYKRGFIERWATGTLRMMQLCKEEELPEPEFSEVSGGIRVTFKFKSPIGPHDYTQLPKNEAVTLFVLHKDSAYSVNFSARQNQILKLLRQYGEMSSRDILTKLENIISARTLRYDLKQLKKLNIIGSRGKAQQATWFLLPKIE